MKRIYGLDETSPEFPYLVAVRENDETLSASVTSQDGRLQWWVPHEKEGYVQAEVLEGEARDDGDDVTVKTQHGEVRCCVSEPL